MTQYIKVAEDEGEDSIEIPCESDNTILLTTLASQFPCASGLRYRNSDSGTMRGVRLIDGKLQPPDGDWPSISVYYCCFPKENKRKIEDQSDPTNTKTKRVEEKKGSDLIVLGLAWKTSDKELKEYFEQFGDLLMAQVKKDPKTGFSKGFGFIRFADNENQTQVISKRHCIDGRWCDVRVPLSKDGNGEYRNPEQNRKIFIGRLTSDISTEDLKEYFSKYGDIVDIFIPKPFRGFAFITFQEITVAQALFGEDHIIKGISVHVSNAVPKAEMNRDPYPQPYNQQREPYHNGNKNRYVSSAYSSYPTSMNNQASHLSPTSPPSSQYDYYSRSRSNPPPVYNHPDSGNPYVQPRYNSYSSANYGSPYY